MDSLICGRTTCPPVVGNVLVYQDSHHLTSAYALTTAPYLEQRLLKVSKTLSRADRRQTRFCEISHKLAALAPPMSPKSRCSRSPWLA